MKHKLTNNWGLKLGSLIFAFFLWIIVTNMNDPVIQYKVYNVPVRFINTGVVTDEGKTYEVLDNSDIIDTVTITAARSVIDSLDDDDVVAVADFNDLTLQDTIAIRLSTNKYNSNLESIRGNIDTVQLNIEKLKTKTLALNTIASGTVSEGYIVGDITSAQNQIRISGPESVIYQIEKAEASVSVTGFTQDISTSADINLLSAEGEIIDSESVDSNINTVSVDVEILPTKRVELSFGTIGTPAEGYEANGTITSDPETVLIAGKARVLKNMDVIEIDADALNITGQAGNMMTLIDIDDYLPSGIRLAEPGFDGNVSVTVYIERTINRTLNLNASDIKLTNIPEGYKATVVDPEEGYEVAFNGLSKNVNSIDKLEVTATADLSNILDQEDKVDKLYHTTLKFTYNGTELKVNSPVQIWIKLDKT